MSGTVTHFAQATVQHALAILQADLPADLRIGLRMGDYLPGLLSQLPFVTVTATIKRVRNTGVGGTIDLKQAQIEGALVDLGYVTGASGLGELTLTLWAITRPQLESVRNALTALTWAQRSRQWEAPTGLLNRATFLTSQLTESSAAIVAPLPPAPPHFTINTNNTDLHSSPDPDAPVLGQAAQGQTFELLGRTADMTFIQGCCFQGQPIWVAATAVTATVALATIPIVTPPALAVPLATPKRRRRNVPAVAGAIDPGTAILATASTTPITAWRQDLRYLTHLELTQEPLAAGDLIDEVQLTQHLAREGTLLHTDRLRITAQGAQAVNNF